MPFFLLMYFLQLLFLLKVITDLQGVYYITYLWFFNLGIITTIKVINFF